jgi:bleomycin hydrolase
MKKLFSLVFFFFFAAGWLTAQEADPSFGGYTFTDEIVIPSTPVKDQYRTSTCWSFGALAMLEAEMIRLQKPETDLSEMFIVFHAYYEKAEKFVRMHGNTNFGSGGAFHDVINVIREHGIVPEQIYGGLRYGEEKHIHGEMDDLLREAVEAVVKNSNGKLSSVWRDAVVCTLNTYLGEVPEKFEYQGKNWSPQSFWRDFIGLNPDDYVEITSFSHHPYYSKFILEIPDNWSWDEMYNVPLSDLAEIIDYSLQKGYTVAWAADNSDKGFQTGTKGIAILQDTAMNVTPEARQLAFDNYETTDDHGMLIAGLAKDQNGQAWYRVKNSWGDYNKLNGWFYASKAYVMYKTTDIMVHRDAIPPHIRKKLNL